MSKQSCGNCRYAEGFLLTPTGRFKQSTSGRCTFIVQIGPRPECVVDIQERRYAVQPSLGGECQVWEQNP